VLSSFKLQDESFCFYLRGNYRKEWIKMIIVMKPYATKEEISSVEQRLIDLGLKPHPIYGEFRTVIGAIGDERLIKGEHNLFALSGVEEIIPVLKPYKLAGRELKSEDTVIDMGDVKIGGQSPIAVMAGPCAVENAAQLLEVALKVKEAGASILRGGAYKPRTSPYAFQGLAEDGLKMLSDVKAETGLLVVTEVLDTRDVEVVARYTDILQIGTRNMQNFRLLTECGISNKPVLLKRGLCSTIEEWLMAAEYILSSGNQQVMLCERGIRTFETATRNTVDISAIPVIKELSHLPIVVDPSHGTGNWRFVNAVAKAAVAAGADALMIEVHPDPANAVSDGAQSLKPDKFNALVRELLPVAKAVGRMM
jgi:3-deoxy-7-phosphoheptulonate synthase